MVHENYNVADLGKSMAFYEKALGLTEKRRINGNGFIIVYRIIYYNFFNIGAYTGAKDGMIYAKNEGWDSDARPASPKDSAPKGYC